MNRTTIRYAGQFVHTTSASSLLLGNDLGTDPVAEYSFPVLTPKLKLVGISYAGLANLTTSLGVPKGIAQIRLGFTLRDVNNQVIVEDVVGTYTGDIVKQQYPIIHINSGSNVAEYMPVNYNGVAKLVIESLNLSGAPFVIGDLVLFEYFFHFEAP